MAKDVIPAKDNEFVIFADNFISTVSGMPDHAGLSGDTLIALTAKLATFKVDKLDNDVKTSASKVATTTKNVSGKDLKTLIRSAKAQISANPLTTDAMRIDLGMPLKDMIPSKISAPAGVPILTLNFGKAETVIVSAQDSLAGLSKAKPEGAVGFDLFEFIGVNPPVSPQVWTYVGNVSAQSHELGYEESQRGLRIHFKACWRTAKGLQGGFGAVVSCTIPG